MTDRADSKVEDPDQLEVDIYSAYLTTGASGPMGSSPSGYRRSLGESYAAALGVHHFCRGIEPLSMRDLLARADEACETGEDPRGVPSRLGAGTLDEVVP